MSAQSESAFYEYIEECQEMLDRLSHNISLTEKNGFNKIMISEKKLRVI